MCQEMDCNGKLGGSSCYQRNNNGYHPYHHGGIPGVFNCRFSNPVASAAATKRKKKKPTSFVPPPVVTTMPSMGITLQQQQHHSLMQDAFSSNLTVQMQSAVPFWRRPLPSQHNHQVCLVSRSLNRIVSKLCFHYLYFSCMLHVLAVLSSLI
jgi:hypothetical protein